MKRNPCINCLVFPMCRSRAIEHSSVFNLSGMFAYIKNHCSILQKAYYDYKERSDTGIYPRAVLPYAKQPFCKDVLNHFKLPPNRHEEIWQKQRQQAKKNFPARIV